MKRREFLKASLLASGAVALEPFPHHLFAGAKKLLPSDVVQLGSTGIELTRMAMGTGTHGVNRQSNQTRRLGVEGLADLLKAAFDEGICFWDSADQYGTHPHLKRALSMVPREKVTILTKTHASTEAEMKADLDRFRQELGTDYLDIVLLHNMQDPAWPSQKEGAMQVLAQAREEGIVRAHGVSCHTLGALQTAAKTDWVQVDLARINPAGMVMDADVQTVASTLKRMKDAGKAVIAMKVFGAGRLRDRVDECLQYALAQSFIDCFTIGVETEKEMRDLLVKIPAASVRA
jgi:aryl-alcohol dehydrogenase-like predicted oxidoreductase